MPDADDRATTPHDAFAKKVLADPKLAKAYFRKEMSPRLVRHIDWRTFKQVPVEHIGEALNHLHSDLLFEAHTRSGKRLLLFLFEHQSTIDPDMPLRLLHYMVLIWLNKARPLPVVLCFVLHQGPERWTGSPHFESMFALDTLSPELRELLLPYIPKFQHGLLDLSQPNVLTETEAPKLDIALHLMKAAREGTVPQFFEWLVAEGPKYLRQLDTRFFQLMMVYAWNVDESLDVNEVSRQLVAIPELERQAMTIADKLRKEGREEGLEQGLERGLEQGLEQGIEQGLEQGIERGLEHGQWIGKIRLLQDLMQEPESTEPLEGMPITKLKKAFRALEKRYNQRFKR
jgi:hypothetical protein